jgi:hypothetical protein
MISNKHVIRLSSLRKGDGVRIAWEEETVRRDEIYNACYCDAQHHIL